jgi:hypothetical protein
MKPETEDFEKASASQRNVHLLHEIWDFLKANKKWWLLPIIVVMLLLSVLMILGGSAAAPFIYTLF